MLAALFISVLTSCSSYNYYTAAANKTNLSQYKTFAMAPAPQNPNKQWRPLTEIGNGKIQQATENALTAKGLTMSNQNPDLLVTYATVTGRGTKIRYSSPWGYPYGGWGWGGWGWGGFYRPYFYGGWGWPYYGGWGGTYAQRVPYKEGTIIIDLIDSKTQAIVWRGYGVGELTNPKQTLKEVPKVVEGIIKQLELVPAPRKS